MRDGTPASAAASARDTFGWNPGGASIGVPLLLNKKDCTSSMPCTPSTTARAIRLAPGS
jgi:hypothetical protein